MPPVRSMLPMRADEFCPRQMQVAELGALGFSLKSVVKKATSAVKKAVKGPVGVVRAVVAPITVGTTAVARGATWVAGKAGIPGAAKASDFLRKELDKQAAVVGAHTAVGAVVGGAIAAAPAVAAAAGSVGLTSGAVTTAATALGKDAALNLVKGAVTGGGGGGGAPPPVEEVSVPAPPELLPMPGQPRMLKAGMLEGPNLYVTVGGAMALGLIAYALYGTKAPPGAASAVAPGPLSSLNRSRRSRRGSRRRARR